MTVLDTTKTLTGSLSRESVEALARRRQEPDWLRQIRLDALAHYESTPLEEMPTGNWRRSSLNGIDLEHPIAFVEEAPATMPMLSTQEVGELAAVLSQRDGGPASVLLDPEADRAGVRVLDLAEAARDPRLAEKVQRHLAQVVRPTEDKFTALHYAFLNQGAVVYLPAGVVLEKPILLRYEVSEPGLAGFTHTLLIVDDNAEATVLEEYTSPERSGTQLASSVLEIVTGRGAQVKHAQVQDWAQDVWNLSWQRSLVAPDAHVRTLNVALGGRHTRNHVQVILEGNGGQADLLGVVLGNAQQHFDFQTLQEHFGSATRSDLVIHNALDGRSSSNFTGLIRIDKQSRQTESSQEQKNVLLSPRAKADSDPKLEILNNDVIRCTHGAAVGPMDPELVFYLQSRGLDREQAQGLVLEGFFRTVLETLKAPTVEGRAWERIQRKLS